MRLDFAQLPLFVVLLVALGVTPATAVAEPAFARLFKQAAGYAPSCNACHKDGGGTPLNQYGEDFKSAGYRVEAFEEIAGLDSDGDGFANSEESAARSDPGSENSTPGKPGNWLDTESLIPREVQALFPGVRAYLPRDAILTASDIDRASVLGARLDAIDENTIYVPLAERRPVGTAIIFPAEHEGKTFFLVMATDRKLTVTKIEPIKTTHLAAAADPKLYRRFVGVSLDKLPVAEGEGLQYAVARAVKKAGTLVYVRLKGA